MSPKFLIPLLLLTMALAACSDDSPTQPGPDPDILLTLDLNEYFMETFAAQGIVFASDAEGNVLDVATWDGPVTIVLKNTTVHPDTISFTFFQSSNWEVQLATEVGVPAGSVWTYTGTLFPPKTGTADVGFSTVPPHDGYRISSSWASFTGSTLPHQRPIEIYGEDANCFVRIDPLDGPPVGGWLRGLYPHGVFTFDFHESGPASPLTPTQVHTPSGGDRLAYSVNWFETGDIYRYNIKLDGGSFEDVLPRSITVYTPEIDSANLGANFHLYTDGNPSTIYSQESVGPLPSEFAPMEGNLTVTSTSPDSLAFTTASDWDRFTVSWSQIQDRFGNWYVEGRAPITEFSLPKLPPEITAQIPDYPPQGFVLDMLTIIRDGAGSVTHSQGKFFHPVGPGSFSLEELAERYNREHFSLQHIDSK